MASNPEDVIADIVQQMRTRAMVAGQASLEERDDALREAQEHEAYFLTTACDALEAEVARLTAAQATPPANPTPQGPLTCESCGASDVYRCGCYDRCRCDHDRRSHTPHGICTHVGCACTNGLHGRGTWATPPASPEPLSARWQELFWALPPGELRHKLRALESDIGQALRAASPVPAAPPASPEAPDRTREAFRAGFLAVCKRKGDTQLLDILTRVWSFDGVAAADLEPEAYEAWRAASPVPVAPASSRPQERA